MNILYEMLILLSMTLFYTRTNKIFVIAEAGSNWKSGTFGDDLKQAKKLIEVAAKAGADAVKFQTYKPETVYVQNPGKSSYLKKSGINENVYDIFKRNSMPYKMLPLLAKHCKKNKIMFMSTAFSVNDAKEINKFSKVHKIASFEINHIRLLEYLGKTKKPIIISTGASTYKEIDFALKILKKNKSGKIFLLHTISKYPAPPNSLNLKAIKNLKEKYNLTVGLSDHSLDPIIAPLISIGLGGRIIEKHFTLNKNLKGPDHKFALNPKELMYMISVIRIAETMLGIEKKIIMNDEFELQKFAKRSIQSISDIPKGEKFVEDGNFAILRPGNQKRGAEPMFFYKIKGKRAKRRIKVGDGIHLNDCE